MTACWERWSARAITVIGERELYNLVLAVSAVTTFNGIPNVIVNMDTFWRHSLYCGLIARSLAKKARILHPERLFVAGLLHDVGSLVLFNRAPGVARELVMLADGDEDLLCQAEAEELGFTHADLGGLLLEQWQIPDALRDAVRGHHEPASAGPARREAAIVHIADLLANSSAIGAFFERPAAERRIRVHAWDLAGIVQTDVDPEALIGEAGLHFANTASFLVGSA